MSEDSSKKYYSSATHQRLQHSTTLNRRYVHRPEPVAQRKRKGHIVIPVVDLSEEAVAEKPTKIEKRIVVEEILPDDTPVQEEMRQFAEPEQLVENSAEIVEKVVEKPVDNYVENPILTAANARLAQTWEMPQQKMPSAQELKEEAIRKAMHAVATMEMEEQPRERRKKTRVQSHKQTTQKVKRVKHKQSRMRISSKRRVALAVACAVAVVGVIGYFVSVNLPSVSYGVMAMQSGIDLKDLRVPRDFTFVTSSVGDDMLSVTYEKDGKEFVLTAEKSSWDNKALVANYVEVKWRSYDTLKEGGLTIYVSGSRAAWVNGGVKYTIDAPGGTLTNKQIKTMATSL